MVAMNAAMKAKDTRTSLMAMRQTDATRFKKLSKARIGDILAFLRLA